MCLLPSRILYRSEWLRMLASTVMHADDMHLYFNMISFLWKGRRLEPWLVFALATSSTMIGLSYLADEVFSLGGDFMNQCAVGFSGVLFALKVLHTTYFPYSDHYLFGWLPIPSQFACWAELFLLQMLTPNASFIGHLSGVIVGLAYTMGPLKTVVNILENIISLLFGIMPESSSHTRSRTWSNNRNWFTNWGFGGRNAAPHQTPSYGWRNEQRRFDEYTGGMSEEEQIDDFNGYYYHYVPYGSGLLFMFMLLLICCCCMISATEIPPYGYYYDCIFCGPCIHCRTFRHHHHPIVAV
ncbi:Rhomboid-related protein 4 [Dirofilaria immitis]|nr:Rhomboid-related protein 4 [Dirofilaria immitis]